MKYVSPDYKREHCEVEDIMLTSLGFTIIEEEENEEVKYSTSFEELMGG